MPVHHEDREADDAPTVRVVDAQGRDVLGIGAGPLPVVVTLPIPSTAKADPRSIVLFKNATAAATSPTIDRGDYRGPAALVIANVGTGSPAMSVDIKGSVDGINFYNVGYALVATPNTVAVAQIAITATATTTYLLVTDQAWRYLNVVVSAVTTETWNITYYQ